MSWDVWARQPAGLTSTGNVDPIITMQEDEYLTVVDVAKLARTTPSTVRYWRNQGTGPRGFICGRHILYARSDVQQWLDDLRKRG